MNNTYVIYVIVAICFIITLILIVTIPTDVSKCPDGTDRREGACKKCVLPCKDGFTPDGACGCTCNNPQYDQTNPDAPTTVVYETEDEVEHCVSNYCSKNQLMGGLVYDYNDGTGGDCTKCSDESAPCTEENGVDFCCANGGTCDGGCCGPNRTYIGSDNNLQCCPSGNITKVNGEKWKPGDEYCKGTSDSCCSTYCTIPENSQSIDKGDWCPSNWVCTQAARSTKKDADKAINDDFSDPNKYLVTDGPTKITSADGISSFKFSACYVGKGVVTRLGGPVSLTETKTLILPSNPNAYYNLNINDGLLVIPSDMLDIKTSKIVAGEDYSKYLLDAASWNNERLQIPKGLAIVSFDDIYRFIVGKGEGLENFIKNYIKGTDPTHNSGSIGGFYAKITPVENDASWTRVISVKSSTLTEGKALIEKLNDCSTVKCLINYVFVPTNEMQDPSQNNCIGFIVVDNPFPDTQVDDFESLLTQCKKAVPTSLSDTVTDATTAMVYFVATDRSNNERCQIDGQLVDVDGSDDFVWVSTTNIDPDQRVPSRYSDDKTLNIGTERRNAQTTGLLRNSGGPMCLEYANASIPMIQWNNGNQGTTYTSREGCELDNSCYPGYARNKVDGACNVNLCTDTGAPPPTQEQNVNYSVPPTDSKYWLHGKDGCYRKTSETKLVSGTCNSKKNPFYPNTCDKDTNKITASTEAKELGFRADCRPNGNYKCGSRLMDDAKKGFVSNPSVKYYWCMESSDLCKTVCNPTMSVGQANAIQCRQSCTNTNSFDFERGGWNDTTDVLSKVEDTKRGNFNCKPSDIPM